MQRGRTPFLVLGVPLALLGLRLVAHLGAAFAPVGDLALIELSVVNATRGQQLLGAYSRFGWDQLGPAWFYLAAPVYWVAGADTRALFLAAFVINAAAAVGVVAVVRRRLGVPAATWSAAAICLWMVAVGPETLISPWNPHAAALPLLLTLVLAAAAMAGSGWSLVGAAAAGSVVVQCHLGTAPVVAAALLLGGAGWVARLRPSVRWATRAETEPAVGVVSSPAGSRRPPPASPDPAGPAVTRHRRLAAAAAAGLAALWLPTVIEQLSHSPGNLVALGRFARDGFLDWPRTQPLSEAATTVARTASMVPLGPGGSLHTEASGSVSRAVVAGGWVVAAGGVAVVAWRRNRSFAASCAAVTLAAGAAAVFGATRVVGGLLPYLTFFAAILPVGVLIASAGLLPFGSGRSGRATALCLIAAAVAVWAGVRSPTEPEGQSAAAAGSARLIAEAVPEPGAVPLMVRETDHRHWPHMSGVVLGLDRAGHDVRVDRELVPLVGESWGPGRRPRAEVIMGEPDDPLPAPTRPGLGEARVLGDAWGYRVWFRPLADR